MSTSPVQLSISGMSCAGCVNTVETALRQVAGVDQAEVNFAEHTAMVYGHAGVSQLVKAVKDAGYDAAELRNEQDQEAKQAIEFAHYRKLIRKFVVAAVVGVPLFSLGMSGALPALTANHGQLIWLFMHRVQR